MCVHAHGPQTSGRLISYRNRQLTYERASCFISFLCSSSCVIDNNNVVASSRSESNLPAKAIIIRSHKFSATVSLGGKINDMRSP